MNAPLHARRACLLAASALLVALVSGACSGGTDNDNDTASPADTMTTMPPDADVEDDTGAADVADTAEADVADTAEDTADTAIDTGVPGDTSDLVEVDLVVPGCDPGFDDCDGDESNGCETSLADTATHCGACGTVCPSGDNAEATCENTVCGLACDAGFGDCDGDPQNGCEVALETTPEHCSSCDNLCTTPQSATATCESGLCGFACETDFGDCNADGADGCETDHLTDLAHCGTCGNLCPTPTNATPTCETGTCGFACEAGFDDCNANGTDGCEIDLLSTVAHCSACNTACPAVTNATPTCQGGQCGYACTAGYFDVDGDPANGCEAYFARDNAQESGLNFSAADFTIVGYGSSESYFSRTHSTSLYWKNLDGTGGGSTATGLSSARVDTGRGPYDNGRLLVHTPQSFLLTAPSSSNSNWLVSELASHCTTSCGVDSYGRVLAIDDTGGAWNVTLANASKLYWYRISQTDFTGETCVDSGFLSYHRCLMDSISLTNITSLDLQNFPDGDGTFTLVALVQNGALKLYRPSTTQNTSGTLVVPSLSGVPSGTSFRAVAFLPPGTTTAPGLVTVSQSTFGTPPTTTTTVNIYRFTRDGDGTPTGLTLESSFSNSNYAFNNLRVLDAHNVLATLDGTLVPVQDVRLFSSTPAGLESSVDVAGGSTIIDKLVDDPRGGRIVLRDGGDLQVYTYSGLP